MQYNNSIYNVIITSIIIIILIIITCRSILIILLEKTLILVLVTSMPDPIPMDPFPRSSLLIMILTPKALLLRQIPNISRMLSTGMYMYIILLKTCCFNYYYYYILRYIVNGDYNVVNPEQTGTKCCALYKLEVASNEEVTLKFKLSTGSAVSAVPAKIGAYYNNYYN